jgi:GNAT superfamily N-acetyltransferase
MIEWELSVATYSPNRAFSVDIPINIRSAQPADHPQLSQLFDELDRLHREAAPWLLQKPERDPRPPEWLEGVLAEPKAAVLVADAGRGQCIGLASLRLRDAPAFPLFIPQQHAVLDDLVVHPDWRRRGVGRRLYEACEAWARRVGAPWLELNVYDFNTEAYAFYTALGFATTVRKLRKPLT